MREELLQKILIALQSEGIDTDRIKPKLIIAMNDYEITARCTEVAVVNEDDTEKYIKLFLMNKTVAGCTKRTIGQYRDTLLRFFKDVQKSPLDITSDDIKMYLALKEVRDHASKVYTNDILRVISSFYTWMTKEEHIIKNPMNKVDKIKLPKTKKNAFTEQEIEKMRIAIKDDLRMTVIFEMLLSTWCRISELCNMKISDLSEDRGQVLVHGKGQKDRYCYIGERAKIYLNEYLSQRPDDSIWLFPACSLAVSGKGRCVSRICAEHKEKMCDWWKIPEIVLDGPMDKSSVEARIRKLGIRAGVEKAHPHRFRRTGATFALRRGMPIEYVSKLLGHESIETTQIYLDISENELEQSHRKYV